MNQAFIFQLQLKQRNSKLNDCFSYTMAYECDGVCVCVEKEQDKGKMRHMINTLRFILVEYFYHFKEIEQQRRKREQK